MAIKYLRLFPAVTQFQLKGGQLNVAGRLYVHFEATDDLADLYDENGTQLTQPVILDNNGRAAGLFVDSSKVYWLDVQDQFGMSQFTIRKMTPCGGGGGATLGTTYELVSSDGSIAIDMTTEGNVTTYDLTRPDDSTELLEWIRCDGATKNSDTYTPIYTDGTMEVGVKGIKVYADRYYHVTAHLRASKSSVQPYYDKVDILFRLVDGNNIETNVIRQSVIVDSSVGLVQDFEVSTDVKVEEDAELLLDILNTTVQGITWEVLNLEAHRVFSGAPVVPGGVANKPWVEQNFQPMLTAGDNIYIDTTTWTISAAGGGGGGGSIYNSGDGVIVHNTGNHEIDIDWTKVQPKLTAGDNINIDTTTWTISATGGGSTYTGGTGIVVDNVEHTISLDGDVVIDANYVHTDNNFTTIYKNKLDGIQDGAEQNVQSDWNVSDTSSDAYIRNKPDLSQYATQSDLAGKQDKLTAGNNITITNNVIAAADQIQSDWNQTTVTAKDYIKNKPTIPSGNQLLPPATSADEDKVLTIDNNGDPQWETPTAFTQQQADWNQTNTAAVDYIKNKPTIVTPVQSDWNQTNSAALDFIKNKPSVLSQGKDLVAGTNVTLQQTSDSVIISAQYAGATYNTQQISGSGHIMVSSTAQISTDLTESGELAAFYRVRYTGSVDGWQPSATVGDGGALFTMNVGSTYAYTEFHDYTGGVFTQNHFESLARTGSIDTYSGYLYSVHFNSNGQINPRTGYSMWFEFIENLPGSTSEYSWVSDGFSQAASPIDLSYDTIGGKKLKLKMYNINSDQLSVYSYPYITIIVRRL